MFLCYIFALENKLQRFPESFPNVKEEQGSSELKQARPANRLNVACVYLLYTYKVTSPLIQSEEKQKRYGR